ncbi:MAG: DUF1934 domain-containing protein [Lachnospiraceae bacterium]|nr:DUF1934 domain-containing protein [Lachnospiraceae bacterium]MCR4684461.1 DUF1934 domain-containing protein [Lachnospiraceae bacterium]
MTKDVMISVSGIQFGPDVDGEKVEVITKGNYYKKKNKHYLLYDEITEGIDGVTKNTVKFDENAFQLTKSGVTNVNMLFEENKRNITNYITPFGSITIGIDAHNIEVIETDEQIRIRIDYALDVNYEHLANCEIRMDISSKDAFSLDPITQ